MRILVFGLPGSGKTTFAEELYLKMNWNKIATKWFNADKVREEYKDWDFSPTGRERQAKRMRSLCMIEENKGYFTIADFVCPTQSGRSDFGADIIIFMDTITEGRFGDTNKVFDNKCEPTYHITNWSQNEGIIREILHKLFAVGK